MKLRLLKISTKEYVRDAAGWAGFKYVFPYSILVLTLVAYPLLAGLRLSFYKADLFGASQFIGIQNYKRLLRDELFLKAVLNTSYFVLMTVPALTIIGFTLAVLANSAGRLAALFRGVFFFSTVLSVTIVTLAWRMMLDADNGLINQVLGQFGISPVVFLGNPRTALPAIALVTLWWCIGLPMMLFIAALQQIPNSIYEAAVIDNVGFIRRHLYITIPLIRRTVISVVVIEAILQYQLFGQPELMTFGGPNGATFSIVLFIHQIGFDRWDIGYAAAASQLLLSITFLIASVFAAIRNLKLETRGVKGHSQ